MNYKSKYFKYKQKYLELKNYYNAISGGCVPRILPYLEDYKNLIRNIYIIGEYQTRQERSFYTSEKGLTQEELVVIQEEKQKQRKISYNNFIDCASLFVANNLDFINNLIYIDVLSKVSIYSETNIIFVDGDSP